ncbi:hypothetical protein CLAIMM_10380 [Cladophialophora immunda]|nr:hypothetical protein CLAIMM_10380 [Cladophialophora immunda]
MTSSLFLSPSSSDDTRILQLPWTGGLSTVYRLVSRETPRLNLSPRSWKMAPCDFLFTSSHGVDLEAKELACDPG